LNKAGLLLVVVGPSGCGKTSVTRRAMERLPELCFSVSCTTRGQRAGEQDGVDYFFLDAEEFKDRLSRQEFLEHAEVHGNLYGTLRGQVETAVAAGKVVLLDIDVQGARQVRAGGADAVFVFMLPPSPDELERRLRGRATDSEEVISGRLITARSEMSEAPDYDYLIVNDVLDEAVDDLLGVVVAERLRRSKEAVCRRLALDVSSTQVSR
jgi:guanylate kinase